MGFQKLCCSKKGRCMKIMSAGMHFPIDRRKRQSCLFLHRKCIHIAANQKVFPPSGRSLHWYLLFRPPLVHIHILLTAASHTLLSPEDQIQAPDSDGDVCDVRSARLNRFRFTYDWTLHSFQLLTSYIHNWYIHNGHLSAQDVLYYCIFNSASPFAY